MIMYKNVYIIVKYFAYINIATRVVKYIIVYPHTIYDVHTIHIMGLIWTTHFSQCALDVYVSVFLSNMCIYTSSRRKKNEDIIFIVTRFALSTENFTISDSNANVSGKLNLKRVLLLFHIAFRFAFFTFCSLVLLLFYVDLYEFF